MTNEIAEKGRVAQWIAHSAESLALVVAGVAVVLVSSLTMFHDQILLPRELVSTITIGSICAVLIIELRREIMMRRQYRQMIDDLSEIKRRLDLIERRIRTIRQRGRAPVEALVRQSGLPVVDAPRRKAWWLFGRASG